MRSVDNLLIKQLYSDLSVKDNREFFEHIQNCTILKNNELLLNRKIYKRINWGRQDVEVFDYIIKLLKSDNIILSEKLITFFSGLENKEQHEWDEYQKGYQFYPLLLFYMITLNNYDLLHFGDENVYLNFFNLEPENTDWSYVEEYLAADYLGEDYCNISIILDTIINSVTIKNIKVINMVKAVIKNTIVLINNDIGDDYSYSDEIELFDGLSEKINNLELNF